MKESQITGFVGANTVRAESLCKPPGMTRKEGGEMPRSGVGAGTEGF